MVIVQFRKRSIFKKLEVKRVLTLFNLVGNLSEEMI